MVASMHPQAKFDPIAPDLDLHELVDQTQNLRWVQRVSLEQVRHLGPKGFEQLVQVYVIDQGQPLVIEGWDAVLPKPMFTAEWLEQTYDKKQENVRDIVAGNDIPMTTGHYLRSMKQLTNQWTSTNYRDERRQRLYMKDIDCPPEWHEALKKLIHPSVFYLNDNVSAKRGGRRNDDDDDEDIFADEAKPAIAGDLMSSLPEEMRAQNLMCYVGHEGTYTPAHREMCASLGQNIMVEASGSENGEKPGSSVWFMTESNDRAVVREYFLSMLGHDIEIEKHFAQINAWKRAPFDVYVVEQKVGDFILIPPLAAHQVWNRGTRTMKVAWNRTTADTLSLALHEALPKARLVCRDEQYKNKAIIYYTLEKYYDLLQNMDKQQMSFLGIGRNMLNDDDRTKQLAASFKQLVGLFAEVLVDEMFAVKEKEPEFIEFDSCVTCSYCRSNIFNRFLTCKHCVRPLINGDEDTYDVCMECYAMGRSCACLSGLQWCEQWKWSDLVDKYETWRALVIKNDGYIDIEKSPQPFEVTRLRSGRRSVAEICQEALKRRPWKDITKPDREKTPSDSEPEGPDGKPKKKKSRKAKRGETRRCHVCCHPDYAYRVQMCTNPECNEGYCYGVLYRAFDMMPQKVLADEQWLCPKCLGICNCGACRRSGNTDPYTPKNTSLGHDTRPIADDRSIEALVDFRVHNLTWLKAAGEESRSKDSRRMKRLREQADNVKATASQQAQAVHGSGALDDDDEPNDHRDSVMAGYGDQSHILGEDGLDAAADHAQAASAQLEGEASAQADVSMAEPDTTMNDSMYPDPTTLATQRIGMGFWEQDDTPDAILFDPYQAPSPQTMTMTYDKSDVSEFVKKSIRAAKRKEKKANEDPEFQGPRSHHRKPRISKVADFLEAMDPALFAQAEPTVGDANMTALGAATTGSQPLATANGTASEAPRVAEEPSTYGFPANEPELRHAKPTASYLEPEDMDVDAIEEMMRNRSPPVTRMISPRGSPDPQQGNKTAAELASDAVRAALGGASSSGRRGPGRPPGSASTGKRRGRPPKQATVTVELGDNGDSASPKPEQLPKRRGRPPKARVIDIPSPKENETEGADRSTEQDDTDADIAELHAELGRSLATDEGEGVQRTRSGRVSRGNLQENLGASLVTDEANSTERTRSGRPRRSGVSTIASGIIDRMDLDDEEESEMDDRDEAPPSKKRGRPRRSDAAAKVAPPSHEEEPNVGDTTFMSMKERMALRGKSFKMRGKRPGRGARSSAGPKQAESLASPRASSVAQNDTSDSDKSPPPPRSLAEARAAAAAEAAKDNDGSEGYQSSSSASSIDAVPQRQTVVRLGDHNSDSEDGTYLGTRGGKTRGSAPRARGRGRGRGRGRA